MPAPVQPVKNPLQQGTLAMSPYKGGSFGNLMMPTSTMPTKLTSMGVKPVQPGGVNSSQTNTLPAKQIAPPAQQQAKGNSQSPSPITGNTTTPSGATVNATTGATVTPPPSLGGTVGTLLNTAQQGSGVAQGYTAQTAGYGAGNIPIGQEADAIAKKYAPAFASLLPQFNSVTGYGTTGTSPVAEGRAAVATQAGQNEANMLTSAETAELQGIQPQLTAQQQAAGAANQAAGQATTQQGQTITGLTAAGQLQTPGNQFMTVPFNQQLVGADGQPIGGSGGSGALQSAVVNAINLIKNGSGYSNAIAAANLGQFGPQGTTALLNALGPKFNVNMADADAAAVAQNINTAGTAGTSAANTAYSAAVQKVSNSTSQYQGLTGLGDNLHSTLSGWQNTGSLTNINQALNTIAGLTSDPNYAKFVAALANTQSAFTAAFQSAGITPTANTANAIKELDPNSSALTIISSLNQLTSDVHAATVVPAYQQQQTYGQQLGIQ